MSAAWSSMAESPNDHWAAELAAAWARGERPGAADFFAQHPQLLEQPEVAIRLIYEETCLRQEHGEEVDLAALQRQYPQWSNELAVLLDCHRLVAAHLETPEFPSVGETLGEYRLIAELGRGGGGVVFLATQPELADRPVVLKVTRRQDTEFLSLARLQHTHIIPLYDVQDFPERQMRALCLPYFGGATLAVLLTHLHPIPPDRRTGRLLVDTLDRVGRTGPLTLAGRWREMLTRSTYADAICRIGVCLAEALQYAHERGVVHLDLKPANVLLSADGQPMLLDFHLARHPVDAGQPASEGLGGTPEYMSPEQKAAYLALCQGQPIPLAVDGRSDVFSLGRLLSEALGGHAQPGGSVGLADILSRCQATRAEDRYASAEDMATDLRRHLAHLPLQGVRNRSWAERWRKWRKRQPHAPLWVGLLLALIAGAAVLGAMVVERVHDARTSLRDGQLHLQHRRFAEANRVLERGRLRLRGLPGCGSLRAEFADQLRQVQRAQALAALHEHADRLRLAAGAEVLSARELEQLDSQCQTLWDSRERLLDPTGTLEVEGPARTDLRDFVLLWLDLRQRDCAGELLAEMRRMCGEGPATEQPVVRGRTLLRQGNLKGAAAELALATEQRPDDFWAHFYTGTCAYRQGRPAEAVSSFSVAIALAPKRAELYHNRGLAHDSAGNLTAARRDYDRALTLDPTLAAAALNRGAVLYRQRHHAEAEADLQRALRLGADPGAAYYNLALVQQAKGEVAAARESVRQALQAAPGHAQARVLAERLRAVR